MAHVEGQQHPIGIYFKIWGLLFVLSAGSYMVDYLHFEGYIRWSLILIFMFFEGGTNYCLFHAHGLGTVGPGVRCCGSAGVTVGASGYRGT